MEPPHARWVAKGRGLEGLRQGLLQPHREDSSWERGVVTLSRTTRAAVGKGAKWEGGGEEGDSFRQMGVAKERDVGGCRQREQLRPL